MATKKTKQTDPIKVTKNVEAKGKPVTTLQLPTPEIEEPDKSYVPDGFDSVDDYLKDMRETYTLDLEADYDNREAALEDKKFAAGEQWDPVVLQQRAGLPCLTIDTVSQFTAQLVGDWRQNKIGVKVLPAENGDKDIAATRADLIRAIETQSRADRVYNSAFESMVQCGDGAFRVAVQYASEDVFDQEIVIQSIEDCHSVVWDRLSVDITGRDAGHVFVDDLLPEKEFKKNWPDCDPSLLNRADRKGLSLEGWFDQGNVRVTEHWRMIERQRLLAMFQDGSIHGIYDEKDYESGKAADQIHKLTNDHGPIVKTRMAPCRYAQMHLVTGFKILSGPYEWRLNRLPIIRMAGRTVSVGSRRIRYGLVRKMRDVIRLKNFWRSINAEMLGYAPKAQWIATESAVEGKEDAIRRAHLTRDPLIILNDEAVIDTNIKRLEPPPIQMALLQEAALNSQDMKDVTGIHDASLGVKSNETSGRAIMARQREGDVASLTYYDNGNAAVLEGGDVTNQLIGQIYDGTRIIRIIGEDEAAKLVKVNDPMDPESPNLALGRYDVAMTTGASYTTRRVEAAESMMEAVQVFPQMMQVAGDLVAAAQDWPGAEELAERLKKMVPPELLSDKEKKDMGVEGPNPGALMQENAQLKQVLQQGSEELKKTKEENLILRTKHDVEMRKLAIEEFKAETGRMDTFAAIAKLGKENEISKLETAADLAMHEDEMEVQRESMDYEEPDDSGSSAAPQPAPSLNPAANPQQDNVDRDLLTQLRIRALSEKLGHNPTE